MLMNGSKIMEDSGMNSSSGKISQNLIILFVAVLVSVIALIALYMVDDQPNVAQPQDSETLMQEPNRELKVRLNDGSFLELILVKPGTFNMGFVTPKRLRNSDLSPAHLVTITKPYWIGKYEVTQRQWLAIMEYNNSQFKNKDNPANSMFWKEAQEFIKRLNEQTDLTFRLPTEAEWEYACRAGNENDLNSYKKISDKGEFEIELDKVAWYSRNSERRVHPVGQKQPNAWGIFDMHGNVAEWCGDYFGKYPLQHLYDPTGPDSGDTYVIRGGDYSSRSDYCRASYRLCADGTYRWRTAGFRVAASYDEPSTDNPN